MNRKLTNIIRFVMDECLPPIIRDNKYFMMPFYWVAYRGSDIALVMNFKHNAYRFSKDDYVNFYKNLSSLSRRRETDLTFSCIQKLTEVIPKDALNLLDVGCGNGYFLKHVNSQIKSLHLTGLDVKKPGNCPGEFVKGFVEELPFKDEQFDVVVCSHTLEHVINLSRAIAELKRVYRRRLLVVVPRQRYYFYTLDEHVHFFMNPHELAYHFDTHIKNLSLINGDWLIVVDKKLKG